MGLDMYLEAEKYVSGWKYDSEEDRSLYAKFIESIGMKELACVDLSITVSVPIAYWRKANAIHSWFVNTLADGVDDCKRIYVTCEQLKELADLAAKALACYESGNKGGASVLLPPLGGSFFGSTELDDAYAEDLRDTIRQVTPLLNSEKKDLSFYYQASW